MFPDKVSAHQIGFAARRRAVKRTRIAKIATMTVVFVRDRAEHAVDDGTDRRQHISPRERGVLTTGSIFANLGCGVEP